jgi:hypothetical protein
MSGPVARLRLGLALACIAPASLLAQEHDHPHGRELGKLGRVAFPVSCAAEARPRFEHAMAVLHSFWWEEGDNAFGAVLAADSTCAMALWGLALNAWGNPVAGGPTGAALAERARAAARAAALRPRASEFIAATAALTTTPAYERRRLRPTPTMARSTAASRATWRSPSTTRCHRWRRRPGPVPRSPSSDGPLRSSSRCAQHPDRGAGALRDSAMTPAHRGSAAAATGTPGSRRRRPRNTCLTSSCGSGSGTDRRLELEVVSRG